MFNEILSYEKLDLRIKLKKKRNKIIINVKNDPYYEKNTNLIFIFLFENVIP
jgi:hypothetical protein